MHPCTYVRTYVRHTYVCSYVIESGNYVNQEILICWCNLQIYMSPGLKTKALAASFLSKICHVRMYVYMHVHTYIRTYVRS